MDSRTSKSLLKELRLRKQILVDEPRTLSFYQGILELGNFSATDYLTDVSLEITGDTWTADISSVDYYTNAAIARLEVRDVTITLYTSGARKNSYIFELLGKLYVENPQDLRSSSRFAVNEILKTLPSVQWEAFNVLARQFLESATEVAKVEPGLLTQVYDYQTEESYSTNVAVRELYGNGQMDLHSGRDSTVTRYDFIQRIISLAPRLPSYTNVFRWGNGSERDALESMTIGELITMSGYVSTSIVPWLTFDFSDPVEIRNDERIIFGDYEWDGGATLTFPGGRRLPAPEINAHTDKPYGMVIELPERTHCLYLPSPRQAEILLAHGAKIRLMRKLVLHGPYDNRPIPFYIFTMIEDGIVFS